MVEIYLLPVVSSRYTCMQEDIDDFEVVLKLDREKLCLMLIILKINHPV